MATLAAPSSSQPGVRCRSQPSMARKMNGPQAIVQRLERCPA